MKTFDFTPADTLFCRDQRPLEGGHSFGHGANWPLPTVVHSAVRTALLTAAGCLPKNKNQPGHNRRGTPRGRIGTAAFQWLNILGPFPVDGDGKGETYFPIPRDLVPKDKTEKPPPDYLRIISNHGTNDLPKPLTCLVASFAEPSKEALSDWVSLDFYNRYLAGDALDYQVRANLWDTEHRIGVAINPETHTAVEGRLYAAEHLRVRDGVKLRFALSDPPTHKARNTDEGEITAANLQDRVLQLGGEQRFGRIEPGGELRLPKVTVSGTLIKWVLLTPSIFVGGWLPGWIDPDTGAVKLRVINKEERRPLRRQRYEAGWKYDDSTDKAERISATLVAACVGKPQVVGGWELIGDADESGNPRAPGGKATHLAVPSGSVYYFKADSEPDAQKLAKALHDRCRSDFFGEKGLGLGVCGTWAQQDATSGNVPAVATNLKTS